MINANITFHKRHQNRCVHYRAELNPDTNEVTLYSSGPVALTDTPSADKRIALGFWLDEALTVYFITPEWMNMGISYDARQLVFRAIEIVIGKKMKLAG